VNKPFGPALNAAITLLSQAFQVQLQRLLSEEAKSLSLAEGTQADLQKREWLALEKKPKK
jgi:hypothetical protein